MLKKIGKITDNVLSVMAWCILEEKVKKMTINFLDR